MTAVSTPILALRGLVKRYGKTAAVDHVSLEVARGEFLTLLGPSGSGKTTILMTIAGFTHPDGGQVLLEGRDITRLRPERRGFGVVFQGYALFPHMTVAENLAYPLKVRGLAKGEREAMVRRTLDLVQLRALANRRPTQLSGGQQQRVALARALVFDPPVLLLDEPLSALDKKLRTELQMELKALHKRLGRTFINVTHDQEEALSLSDRIAVLNHGKLQQLDTPMALYHRPRTRFVAEFLGKSNFFTGEVTAIDDDIAAISAHGIGVRQRLAPASSLAVGAKVVVAVRPERLTLTSADAVAPGDNALRAMVHTTTFIGTQTHLALEIEGLGSWIATLPSMGSTPLPREGARLAITWGVDDGVVVADTD